ncbi:asparagine synthase-related protein [Halostella salina]|uniref:asparagine synthase-related protein n=1 Tax=Halostella salina TaxID=1547897 RepID=UPI000EF78E14|nr:asparagine synthase-related protein [Halostella salina]
MSGIIGGTVDGNALPRLLGQLHHEEWFETERFAHGPFGLGFHHHGDRDPAGHTSWDGGSRFGVVNGAVSNRDELSLSDRELIEGVLDRPDEVLPELEGSFAIAAVDAAERRVVLAQDKIGTRQCYYATDDGLVFGSEVSALLDELDEVRIDRQGVSDMLLMGHMWGDRTLVERVSALRPASYLEYADGEASVRRYWKPDYEAAEPGLPYLRELKRRFQRSMDRVSTTLDGEAGLWLSGGLDSRMTAAELQRNAVRDDSFDLRTYTYDANPPGENVEPARDVAATLGVPNELVELSAETFAPRFEEVIDLTDGMVRWNTTKNLAAVFNVADPPGVIMEGLEGTLVGHHLGRHHFTDCASPVESMYRSEAVNDVGTVREVLTASVDPLDSFRAETAFTDETTKAGKILDAHFQNYFSRMAHASNQVPRARVGTRVTYADGDLLEHAAKLPLQYRMGTVPFTDNSIPYGTTKPKFWLLQELHPELAEIRYERTGLPPKYPWPVQVAGFLGSTALARLRARATYGGRGLIDEWYRENDALRAKIDDLIDSACDRELFDGDRLRELQAAHHLGEGNHIDVIAPVTTLESWFRRHVDDRTTKPEPSARATLD